MKVKNKDIYVLLFLLVASIAYVYIFSYSTSPLYPYYYGGDTAQFLTIGKAWYLGKLPYVDMFDHKGPFIFWIDMLGFAITNGQKYGVAILQTIFMFFSVLAFYKISQLHYKNRLYGCVVVIITLIAMKRNYWEGNTVEEWCIPFISWSFYGIIQYYKDIDKNTHTRSEMGVFVWINIWNLLFDKNNKLYSVMHWNRFGDFAFDIQKTV